MGFAGHCHFADHFGAVFSAAGRARRAGLYHSEEASGHSGFGRRRRNPARAAMAPERTPAAALTARPAALGSWLGRALAGNTELIRIKCIKLNCRRFLYGNCTKAIG